MSTESKNYQGCNDPEWVAQPRIPGSLRNVPGETEDLPAMLKLKWRDDQGRRHTRFIAIFEDQAGHPGSGAEFLALAVKHLNTPAALVDAENLCAELEKRLDS